MRIRKLECLGLSLDARTDESNQDLTPCRHISSSILTNHKQYIMAPTSTSKLSTRPKAKRALPKKQPLRASSTPLTSNSYSEPRSARGDQSFSIRNQSQTNKRMERKTSNSNVDLTIYSDQVLSIAHSFTFPRSECEEEEMMEGLQMHS